MRLRLFSVAARTCLTGAVKVFYEMPLSAWLTPAPPAMPPAVMAIGAQAPSSKATDRMLMDPMFLNMPACASLFRILMGN
jgi:hypothetical protein